MSSVAQELQPARPPLPSWGTALGAALLGWVIAGCFVLVPTLVADWIGLVGRPAGDGLRDWPYPDAGWYSLVANSIVWLVILAATALPVRGMLADRVDRPVSAVVVFPVLAITGFAPLLPRGLLDLPWPIALLVAAALLRLIPGFGPAPLPKRTTAKLIAVGAALLLVPLAHGILHPLWPGSSYFSQTPKTAMFSLQNAGLATLELESLSLRMPVPLAELRGVHIGRQPPFPDTAMQGLPFELPPRKEAFVRLDLRPLGCGSGPLRAEATYRFRVLGRTRVEILPIELVKRPC
jgi:hypothetical protein